MGIVSVKMIKRKFLILLLCNFMSITIVVKCCNEAVCGSIISKCLLTQACRCSFENCTCCKDCFNCLGDLYAECCSCLDLCPSTLDKQQDNLGKKSHVEDFNEPVPHLFNSLTENSDDLDMWTSETFSFKIDISEYLPKKEVKFVLKNSKLTDDQNILTLNCTVAFWGKCMSWTKCKGNCQSMGASSYRWFHDGCCECIGQHCINYGINESKCKECGTSKEPEDSFEDEDFDDELNYDEFDDENQI